MREEAGEEPQSLSLPPKLPHQSLSQPNPEVRKVLQQLGDWCRYCCTAIAMKFCRLRFNITPRCEDTLFTEA